MADSMVASVWGHWRALSTSRFPRRYSRAKMAATTEAKPTTPMSITIPTWSTSVGSPRPCLQATGNCWQCGLPSRARERSVCLRAVLDVGRVTASVKFTSAILVLVLLCCATAVSQSSLDSRLAVLDPITNDAIAHGQIPGAVVIVGHNGQVVYRQAYGNRAFVPRRESMTIDTVFDCASLTKVVATTMAVMQLWEQGKLRMNDPVAKYLPSLGKTGSRILRSGSCWCTSRGLLRTGLDEAVGRQRDGISHCI